MPADVDPKKNKPRKDGNLGFISKLKGFLPRKFYLFELTIILVIALFSLVIYDFSTYIHKNQQYKYSLKINGLEKVSRDRVKNVLQLNSSKRDRRSLLAISVVSLKNKIKENIPRFKKVTVKKNFPDELVINIEEREPVALVERVLEEDKKIYLPVDYSGKLFKPTPEEVDKLPNKVPVLKGLSKAETGSFSFRRKWKKVKKVLRSIEKTYTVSDVDWVKIRTGGYVELQINQPKQLKVRLGLGSYSRKLKKLSEMIQTKEFLNIERYVNLSDLDNIKVL